MSHQKNIKKYCLVLVCFVAYLGLRIYPYLLSPVPLGYDPGLYLYLWKMYDQVGLFSFTTLPQWIINVYPPMLPFFGRILSTLVDPSVFLIPLSFFVSSCLFLAVFLYTHQKHGLKTAMWASLLLTVSIIQYRFWWWYYIKNILALSFIFFYLYLGMKKSRWSFLFVPAIVLMHQPTAIILFLILIFKRHWKSLIIFLIAFALYYLPNAKDTLQPFLPWVASTFNAASGTFYNLPESLFFMAAYFPFSVYGLYLVFKQKTGRLTGIMFGLVFLIPALGLYLSRRFIPFLDIFAIILAAVGLNKFFTNKVKASYIYILSLFIIIGIFVYRQSAALINEDEFEEIKLLSTTPLDSYILVTDNEYTPWIYGYSQRKAIAPGFGEHDIYWSETEWQSFWQSGDQNQELNLLKKLPKPLYIWKGDKNLLTKFSLQGDCFQKFSWHVFEFFCE